MLKRWLQRIMGLPRGLSYEAARDILEREDGRQMRELAARRDTKPEMLYYLAGNSEVDIREHVAKNPATPIQANELLADDGEESVRAELARKIARLVPNLPEDARNDLRERAIAILEKLAADQLPKVRAIIAEEVKHSNRVPVQMVSKLARDMEAIVATPILEYSPLLGDEDLKEIIAAGTVEGGLVAIANRQALSSSVADAIALTVDVPAISALLANNSAQIREDTLDRLIDHAENVGEWHEPLVLRPELSMRAMRRVAGFVASSLIAMMVENHVLDDDAAEDILDRARKRIASETLDEEQGSILASSAAELHQKGEITDEFIRDSIRANKRGLILHCLAEVSGLSYPAVKRIMLSKSGRTVTALAWKAGLSMRTAFSLQRSVALVPPSQLMPAKNGVDYPLEPEEMDWQLNAFMDD